MGKRIQVSLVLLVLSGVGWFVPSAWAQQVPLLLVNGKPFDDKSCQKLSGLRSITIPNLKEDSLAVAIHLVYYNRGLGAKGFTSVQAFNSFDVVSWLHSERSGADPSFHNVEMDDNGDSFTKAKALNGSRIMILVFSYKKVHSKGATYKLNFCQ
jgi:hypothetical protein